MKRNILLISLILASLIFGAVLQFARQKLSHVSLLTFCDVGQGDAIHLRLNSQDFVIDTGPDLKVIQCLSKTIPANDRVIEHLIISHFDHDHSGGITNILERYQVNNIYASVPLPSEISAQLTAETKVHRWLAPQKLSLDDLTLIALWPTPEFTTDDKNAASLVLSGALNGHTFLLTGDLPEEQEEQLCAAHLLKPVKILKVGHHGSKTSTGKNFVQALRPTVAVISVGAKNRYGHPAESVLANLEGVKILRTDQDGTLQCDLAQADLSCYALAKTL